MLVQKLAVIGVVIAAIIAVVLASLITNFHRNAKSPPSASPTITVEAETLVNSSNSYNSTNSTNSTIQLHHPENLTLSPSTHHPPPPLPAPKNKNLSEQPQENRLRGPPLPSSSQPIRGPAPGTASP
jgi:hypothetical protein